MISLRLLTSVALLLPMPALAQALVLPSHVSAVTVYPQAAEVTRQVSFTAAEPGTYDLVIADLPLDTTAQGMHFAGSDGLTIGAFALRTDRVPATNDADSPLVAAARTALDTATEALRKAGLGRDLILAKAQAADAQVAFLAALKMDAGTLSPDALTALTASVGAQVLAAKQVALAAQAEAAPADKAVVEAQTAVDAAQANLDALTQSPQDHAALNLSVTVAAAGPVTLNIRHFVEDASWRPAYDLALDDKSNPATLTLARGALVSQATGEDWTGVALTLSTARPSEQSDPTVLYPDLRSIGDPDAPVMEKSSDGVSGGAADMAEPAPAVLAAPTMTTAAADFQGVAVTYHLATPVSVASDVEDLRLTLDSLTFAPQVVAQAVPSRDATAFVVANWVNDSAEILLPGDALVSRDGTLVGGSALPMIPPGDKTHTGFGALDGLKLTRSVKDASQGDHGVFTTSTERHETAVLKVQNLTDQAWPVRLLDQVPYSEQDDLQITYTADPAATETDVDAMRGILAWTFDLPAGQSKEVTLDTKLAWPAGKVLQ